MVCFKYRMSRLVSVQWFVVGLCINCESFFTANEIFGCVKERYWRLPMILQNSELSTATMPSTSWRDWVVERGMETSFALLILVWAKSSWTYLCCERNNPARVGITSIPKKKMKRTHIFERKHVTQLFHNSGHKYEIIPCRNNKDWNHGCKWRERNPLWNYENPTEEWHFLALCTKLAGLI